jgi:hypothetical protein
MQRQQYWLDVATPHTVLRWLFLAVLAAVYLVRVFFLQVQLYIVLRKFYKLDEAGFLHVVNRLLS